MQMRSLKQLMTESLQTIAEAQITNEKDFREYVNTVLNKAHPIDFDQKIADKTASDLIKKYGEDFGAAIGALQSGLGN